MRSTVWHRCTYFFCLLATVFFLFPMSFVESAALNWPTSDGDTYLTSPFGWRIHPIYGTEKFHSGIDIGADYGQIIMAAADGIVTDARKIDGYGDTVIIQHTSEISTLYGHCGGLCVYPGEHVEKGQTIAYAGSSGNSTGPHVHFEVRQNDEPVNPIPYLGGSSLPGSSVGPPEKNFSWDKEHDFTKPLYEIVDEFSKFIVEAFERIKDLMKKFLVMLMVIDLALAATFYAVNPKFNDGEQGIFGFLIHKLLLYGILIWMVTNWTSVLIGFCRDFAIFTSGTALGQDSEVVKNIVHDPFDILSKGISLVSPLFEHAILLPIFGIGFLLLIAGILLVLTFFLISWNVACAYLEFYASMLFGFCTFFFAGSKHMRHHAEQGLNGIFYATIKLLIASFMAFIILGIMKEMALNDYIKQKVTQESTIVPVIDGNFGGEEDLERVVNMVGWHESGLNYEIYNGGGDTPTSGDGGYGAWQFTDGRYESIAQAFEAEHPGVLHPAFSPCEPDKSPNRYAGTGITYETGEHGTVSGSSFSYCPENQRLIAMYEFKRLWDGTCPGFSDAYNTYHNWENCIRSWNGGDPNYYQKVLLSAAGAHMVRSVTSIVIDFYVIWKLVAVAMLLLFIVSRINKTVMQLCGGNGFRFTTRDFE